jgi:hypothetical protein
MCALLVRMADTNLAYSLPLNLRNDARMKAADEPPHLA